MVQSIVCLNPIGLQLEDCVQRDGVLLEQLVPVFRSHEDLQVKDMVWSFILGLNYSFKMTKISYPQSV